MPRIHYPKGIRTSRALGADISAGGRRIPRRGCPFFTKAHGALTRRSGESGLSFPRTSPPARHEPCGSEEAVPLARGTSQAEFPVRVRQWRWRSRRGPSAGTFSRKRFSRALLCGAASPHVPGPVDCATSRVSGCPQVPVPLALHGACFSANLGAFNPRSYIIDGIGDSFGGPPLTTSRGLRGTHKAFPEGADDDWRNPVIQAVRAL